METMEYVLIILACVIGSSVIGKLTHHIALPLVQIAVGFAVASLIPEARGTQVSSDLFMMLFIAPLLFNEAREANKRDLWTNKWAILSLAVGLVLVTVVVLGFALHAMAPAIPLAAAFAAAAALGPTDAAAVNALGSTVDLRHRQRALLSGESLINDASGVVAFQFAIAAALTGTFSVVDAGGSFLVLFFGGILAGAAVGSVAYFSMWVMRRLGYEDTTLHVVYEVFTPFVVYLFAEWLGVSGILAVVAAGLIMTDREPTLVSTDAARRKVASDNFWRIIVFLINGIIFVMLGMQLPNAIEPAVADNYSLLMIIEMVVVGALILGLCRFLWIGAMQLLYKSADNERRGYRNPKKALRDALTMTLAGPKGAVTLSMIFTIPLVMSSGELFPDRQLLICLTAGVILVTLLAANFLLPLLAPKRLRSDEDATRRASIHVLEETVRELGKRLDQETEPEYVPALRLVHARYQARLARQRAQTATCGAVINELENHVLELQQQRADELQDSDDNQLSVSESVPYYATLQSIRSSVGYEGSATSIGGRFHSLNGRLRLVVHKLLHRNEYDEEFERIYYDTCLFAIELEHVAINYLQQVIAEDEVVAAADSAAGASSTGAGPATNATTPADTDLETCARRKVAAEVLLEMHEAILGSLWGRINYQQDEDVMQEDREDLELGPHRQLPEGMRETFGEQISKARKYANEAAATTLIIELDSIRHMQEKGRISNDVARELRQRVYAIQASLE